jgi:hypothetical protein
MKGIMLFLTGIMLFLMGIMLFLMGIMLFLMGIMLFLMGNKSFQSVIFYCGKFGGKWFNVSYRLETLTLTVFVSH